MQQTHLKRIALSVLNMASVSQLHSANGGQFLLQHSNSIPTSINTAEAMHHPAIAAIASTAFPVPSPCTAAAASTAASQLLSQLHPYLALQLPP